MKQRIREASPLYPKILFRFTDHPITVWAGVILLRVYFEWVGLRNEIAQVLGGFVKRSNNQIASVEVMLSWFYGLALGASRFEHFTRYRRDPMMKLLLGIARFPSPDTVRRLFLSFNYRRVTEVSEQLIRFSFKQNAPDFVRAHFGFRLYGILPLRGEARGEFEGLQSKKARATESSSVGGVFKRSEKSVVGGIAFGQ